MDYLKLLPQKEQESMRRVFANCPHSILESVQIIKVDKGFNFIEAGERCRNVYIILKGKACGIDMQIQARPYIFKEFKPGRFLGEFECVSGIANYSISVKALSACTLLVISSHQYCLWIKNDANACFLRMSSLLFELTSQTRTERRFFLSTCKERLIQYFVDCFEKNMKDVMHINKSREELSGKMGFCVRTIDRNIKKMEKEEFLSLRSGKIVISSEQYERMKTHLKENLTYKDN